MNQAKWLVYAGGVFFLIYGVLFTFYPIEVATFISGSSPDTPSGVTDMRATYGGMSFAAGSIMIILGSKAESLSLGLKVVAITLLYMAATRLYGMLNDGSPNIWMYLYFIGEVVFGAFALWLNHRQSR
ncbi:DUF4345 domain-containing protein [Vibrio sp. TBV020]|uniref:DUF4345 domain-containing protein n=1 Tax=Vibrio sp. TBV020 TaxID=3137398 RepID=UPI0038CDAC61